MEGAASGPVRAAPENMIVRRLGQADRLLRDQLSVSRARRLRDADAARMALRLQAMARTSSGEPVIADGMAITDDSAHRNESSMSASLEPLNQQVMVIHRRFERDRLGHRAERRSPRRATCPGRAKRGHVGESRHRIVRAGRATSACKPTLAIGVMSKTSPPKRSNGSHKSTPGRRRR